MTKKTLARNYHEYYEKASDVPQQKDAYEVEMFSRLVPAEPALDVLDLGAAEGKLALALARKGHRVTAADIAVRQLELTADLTAASGFHIDLVQCDIEGGVKTSERRHSMSFFSWTLLSTFAILSGVSRTSENY